jgi:prenyltransferase beta subunit
MKDLIKLFIYFEELSIAMDKIYPEKLTWDNVLDYSFDLDYKHPQWVKDHFPLVMIYYKEKAGKLRDSKNLKVMFQNNQNIMTQLVMTADDFGMYHRKNEHKGFKNIVAAITATQDDLEDSIYYDLQKPKKYKNFVELGHLLNPEDDLLRIACEVMQEHYPCDSVGQIRLF